MTLEFLKLKRDELKVELDWTEEEIARIEKGVDPLGGRPRSLSDEEAEFELRRKARSDSMSSLRDDRLWKNVLKQLDKTAVSEVAEEITEDA